MSIYTFSTKKQVDTELIDKIKKECDRKGVVFSAYVIKAIRRHDEVQDHKQANR